MSQEEASDLMTHTIESSPGYVVIGIMTDSPSSETYQTLTELSNNLYVLQYNLNEFYVLIDHSPSMESSIKYANKIRLALFEKTDTIFSIGISRMRQKPGELYACRKEALRACDSTHMFGQNNVIHINYLDSNDIEYIYPTHKEKRLIEATMDGDIDYAFRMLDEIFDIFRSREDLRQNLINKIILGTIVNLNIAAASRVFVFEKIQLDSLSLKKLLAAKSVEETYDFIKEGIKDFTTEMKDITDVSRDVLFHKLSEMQKIKRPITITDLSQSLNTTVGFMNSSVLRNCNGDIFSFLNTDY